MLRYTVLSLLCMLFFKNLQAQINESDTAKFQLRVSLTGNYQQGNVEVLNIKSRLDLVFAPVKNWVFKSQNSSLYQAFYSKKADNDIFSRNFLYYKPQSRFYPFGIMYVSGNFRRKISSRYFSGAGFTWQMIRTAKNTVKLSLSSVYESTRFRSVTYNDAAYNGKDKIELWRGTLFLAGWNYLLKQHLRFYYDAYWQPAFSNHNNYRTQLDIGLDLPVWKGFSFNTLFAYTHENVVATGIVENDKILTFGLAYNFKKNRP